MVIEGVGGGAKYSLGKDEFNVDSLPMMKRAESTNGDCATVGGCVKK